MPSEVMAANTTNEKRSIISLIGSSISPTAKLVPSPAGDKVTSVPCATDMPAFRDLATAKVIAATSICSDAYSLPLSSIHPENANITTKRAAMEIDSLYFIDVIVLPID